jgi:hypothetical protein
VPIDKILVLEQPLGNKSIKIVERALTVCPLPGWRLRLFLLPILLQFLGRHLWVRSPRVARGLQGEGWGDLGGLGFFKRMKVKSGSVWGILAALGKLQIGRTVFTQGYRGVK